MQEGRDRLCRHYPEEDLFVSDVRLLSDAVATPMRSSAHLRGYHASPLRKPHQNHHHHQQQQQPQPQPQPQQQGGKVDAEEHIIQPKKTVTTTTPATAAGQNPNVRLASAIDRYSRVVFPVVFTVFSIMYWAIYIKASSSMVNLAGFVVD